MSSDLASSEEPDSPEAPPASPDYVPGPEEPEQAPLSPDYVPGPKYPEYLAPSDEEVPVEDQPYDVADSPIALSSGYVADSNPEEDYRGGNSPKDGEEEVASKEEKDSIWLRAVWTDESAATPPSLTGMLIPLLWISIRPEAPFLFIRGGVRDLLPTTTPHHNHLTITPSEEESLARLCSDCFHIEGLGGGEFNAAHRHAGGSWVRTMGLSATLDAEKPDIREDGGRLLDLRDVCCESTRGLGLTQLFQKSMDWSRWKFYYETARLLDQEDLVSHEAWAYSVGLSSAVHYELQAYMTHTQMQDFRKVISAAWTDSALKLEVKLMQMIARVLNNMPPRRSSATARDAAAARAAAAAAAPMTAVVVE
ncbi:hypothetical protein Tco_0016532 [Tanacetum coccineum]